MKPYNNILVVTYHNIVVFQQEFFIPCLQRASIDAPRNPDRLPHDRITILFQEMVMKIIRHSRKMFVYSLSILLAWQQISCMEQDPDNAKYPDQKSTNQLTTMLEDHNNVDLLIDTMQQAVSGVHEDDTNIQYFRFHLPERGNRSLKGMACSARQLEGVICEIQTQRQTYDAAFWFNWTQYWNKKYNKRVIRNNFKATIADAYNRRCKDFNPAIIQNLPKSSHDIVPLKFIQYLQKEFGAIPHATRENLRCLCLQKGYSVMNAAVDEPDRYMRKINDVLAKLHVMHDFFDNPPCCLSLWGQSEIEKEHRIFLRTHIISHNSLIARLKCLNTITLPAQMSSTQDQQRQPTSSTQYHSPYVIVIGGHQGQPPPSYTANSYPSQQFSDPFDQGTGVSTMQYKPQDEDDQNKN